MENIQKEYMYKNNILVSKEELEQLAKKLIAVKWKIDGKVYDISNCKFRWDKKRSSIGMTERFDDNNTYIISLSSEYYKTNCDNPHEWEEVIRHEIAHVLDCKINNNFAHNKTWKNIARQIGAVPLSYTRSFKNCHYKWIGTCPNCGDERGTNRRGQYYCAKCSKKNGEISEKYRIQFKKNEKI